MAKGTENMKSSDVKLENMTIADRQDATQKELQAASVVAPVTACIDCGGAYSLDAFGRCAVCAQKWYNKPEDAAADSAAVLDRSGNQGRATVDQHKAAAARRAAYRVLRAAVLAILKPIAGRLSLWRVNGINGRRMMASVPAGPGALAKISAAFPLKVPGGFPRVHVSGDFRQPAPGCYATKPPAPEAPARSFSAVLELGKVDYNGSGSKNCAVTVEVRYTAPGQIDECGNDRPAGDVSITGNIWNPGRSDIYMGGQCADTIKKLFRDVLAVRCLCHIRVRWHMSGTRAGCSHWEELLRAREAAGTSFKTSDGEDIRYTYYLGADKAGKTWSTPEKEHADGILCKPCAVCGYEYGSAWKVEEVPADVVADLLIIAAKYGAVVNYK